MFAAILLSAMSANAAPQGDAPIQFTRSTGMAAEFAYETSDFLKQYEYASPDTMFLNVTPSGAYAANKDFDDGKSKRWFIEEQRWGRDLILADGEGRGPEVGNDLVPPLIQLADDGDVSQFRHIGGTRGTTGQDRAGIICLRLRLAAAGQRCQRDHGPIDTEIRFF